MKFTRLFTGTDQKSHFEDLEMPLSKIEAGKKMNKLANFFMGFYPRIAGPPSLFVNDLN